MHTPALPQTHLWVMKMSQDKAGEYEVGIKGRRKKLVFYFWLEPNFPLSQSDNRCQAEKIMSCECYVFQQWLVWGREWGNWGTRGREPGISTTSASLVTASEIVETQKLASFSALFPPFCLQYKCCYSARNAEVCSCRAKNDCCWL